MQHREKGKKIKGANRLHTLTHTRVHTYIHT